MTRPRDLTLQDQLLAAVVRLTAAGRGPSQKELHRQLRWNLGKVHRVTKHLEERGFVRRARYEVRATRRGLLYKADDV